MISTMLHACLVRGRAGLVTLAVISSAVAGAGTAAAQTPCLTSLAPNEPLCSTAVSDSGWSISHRGPYAQGSSALPGPVAGQVITAEHIDLTGTPITLAVSPAYGDGERAVWGALAEVSPEDREIILLRDFEELPTADIAGMLELNKDAVRQRHSRAVARLSRAFLKARTGEGGGS